MTLLEKINYRFFNSLVRVVEAEIQYVSKSSSGFVLSVEKKTIKLKDKPIMEEKSSYHFYLNRKIEKKLFENEFFKKECIKILKENKSKKYIRNRGSVAISESVAYVCGKVVDVKVLNDVTFEEWKEWSENK